jgi:hypothetical protein
MNGAGACRRGRAGRRLPRSVSADRSTEPNGYTMLLGQHEDKGHGGDARPGAGGHAGV